MTILRIDHVQLAMPRGGEQQARHFYGVLLGLKEIVKPAALAVSGGVWFELDAAQIHLGVETDFRPARKAHVAFEVTDLDRLIERCQGAGHQVRADERLPQRRRVFVDDIFGNRLELIATAAAPRTP
jgi:catechol 2,3-dioxygenase-like lactoylglutathione lyase family enzyme